MIKMLEAMSFTTTDPKNVEAVLSTRFEGTQHINYILAMSNYTTYQDS